MINRKSAPDGSVPIPPATIQVFFPVRGFVPSCEKFAPVPCHSRPHTHLTHILIHRIGDIFMCQDKDLTLMGAIFSKGCPKRGGMTL